MPYRIDYSPSADVCRKKGWLSVFLLTCAFFSVFLVMVTLFWPEGREVLQILLIPGDPEVTIEAAQTFASELDCGMDMFRAASDFIHKVTGYDPVH